MISRYQSGWLLYLLCVIYLEKLIFCQAVTCEIGREKDDWNEWQWVLPYTELCRCSSMILGGMSVMAAKKPDKPLYIDEPLFTNNVAEIRTYYQLDCIDLTCPDDIELDTQIGLSTALVVWQEPYVTDFMGYTLRVNCSTSSGSLFNIGSSLVTCETFDSYGSSEKCNFRVDVKDKEAPVFTYCSEDITYATDEGSAYAMAIWDKPTAVDNSGRVDIDCFPMSGAMLPIGETLVTCTSMDGYGNKNSCSFVITVLDNEEPQFEFNACPSKSLNTISGQATARVGWQIPTATDNSGGTPLVHCLPPPGTEFAIGQANVTCDAIDASGNMGKCSFYIEIRDEEPPIFDYCPINATLETDQGEATANFTWPKLTTNDNSGHTPSVECSLMSGSSFPIGQTIVSCVATDESGNYQNCQFEVKVIDKEIPTISSCPSDQTIATDPGRSTALVLWQGPTGTDNSGEVNAVCSKTSGTNFTIGQTLISCAVFDESSNANLCYFDVIVQDNEQPVITCPENQTVATYYRQPTAVVDWQKPEASDNSRQDPVVNCLPLSGSEFTIGLTVVECAAIDDAENRDHCVFVITVEDNEQPVITCPENQTVATDHRLPIAVVEWQKPEASDNSEHDPEVPCLPLAGSNFTIGVTVVKCAAIDFAGNRGYCVFGIYVEDYEPPVITCPENQTVATDHRLPTAIVEWLKPEANDNSEHDPEVTCLPSSGSEFTIGLTVVECVAIDDAGNRDLCVLGIDVEDREAPIFTACPGNQVGKPTTDIIWPEPSATDNSRSAPSVDCNKPPGSHFDIGLTSIIYEAVDESGNIGVCMFAVTVLDNCQNTLGMENRDILNRQITASSEKVETFGRAEAFAAYNGRLNNYEAWVASPGSSATIDTGPWCSLINDNQQWIQVHFTAPTWITGVKTQGRGGSSQWVRTFKVQCSDNGNSWMDLQNSLGNLVFDGNFDRHMIIQNNFLAPVQTTYIRLLPVSWHGLICMRFELIGCNAICSKGYRSMGMCPACFADQRCDQVHAQPLGFEDGTISNFQITGSKQSYSFYPHNARLNAETHWSGVLYEGPMWIQVDFLSAVIISRIQTQGASGSQDQWVKQIQVDLGVDVASLTPIMENNATKIFDANVNRNGIADISLPQPMVARYLRITVRGYIWHPCMRLEAVGYTCTCPYGFNNGACNSEPGWDLVFKAVSSISTAAGNESVDVNDPFQLWSTPISLNENIPEARQLDTTFKGHYKNSFVLDWENKTILEVKVAMLNGIGSELVTFTFNGVGSNMFNWFAKDRLMTSSYDDICNETHNAFNIEGDNDMGRRWFINRNHHGCPNDAGWMVVSYIAEDHVTCDWERSPLKPKFLYSKTNTYTNWQNGAGVGEASIFAVFVKTHHSHPP